MINTRLFYLFTALGSTFFTANAQKNLNAKKIEYQQGCSFCAGQRFASVLYVYNDGAFYTFKQDESVNFSEVDHSVIIDTATKFLRYDLRSDSIYERGTMLSINPSGILIGEKRKRIQWKLIDSIQVIDGHSCKLAVGDFRGRQFFAWYNPSIKINLGPWKLHGTPGAIIYATDTTGELYFRATKVDDLKGFSVGEVVKTPILPVVGRLKFRAMREELFDGFLKIKPEDESKFTYHITLKKNYYEFE